MKRTSVQRGLLVLAAAGTLALSGCGTAQQPDQADPAAPEMTGAAPIDAALVTPVFGWAMTPDQLLLSHDGGTTLSPVDVPVPAGTVRAAHFVDAQAGVVAAATGDSITVATTRDGGRSWHTTTVPGATPSPTGYSSLSVSFGDQTHGAVLARTATSQAFSLGTIYVTADGGTNWSAHPAPEAGVVQVEPGGGRIWLAGANLHASTDQGQHWTQSELSLAGPVSAATVSPPIGTTLPVTVLTDEHTEIQFLTTIDGGRTWGQPTRQATHGRTGAGVRLAAASTPAGPIAYDTVGGHAYRPDGTDLRPSGLPDGIQTVTFAPNGRNGWTLAGHGTCTGNKQDCTYHNDLLTTTDGGLTWQTAATWSRQVS